jgi:hypothetical protein
VFGWKVRLLINNSPIEKFWESSWCRRRLVAAADSKRDNLSNLGQSQGFGQGFRKVFESIFYAEKTFLRDTPSRFAFNRSSSQEFNFWSFAQANFMGKTYPQAIHMLAKLWKTGVSNSKTKGIRRAS